MSLTSAHTRTIEIPKWTSLEGRKFRAIVYETAIDAPIDVVWNEIHGNYVNISETHKQILASHGLPGAPETGLGAVRHCDLKFGGRDVAIKERIIDLIDEPDHKEFTYDVYESKGFPARVYNTWRVRLGSSGETLLSNVFYYRMRPALMTRPMVGQIRKAARGGVLGFKHFFETGERRVAPGELQRRYAAV